MDIGRLGKASAEILRAVGRVRFFLRDDPAFFLKGCVFFEGVRFF